MNEKLAPIFVPVEVAKLAKEKGFNEWIESETYIPTHYQLIKWLNENHNINVLMSIRGEFVVIIGEFNYKLNADGGTFFEINEALTIALNLIELVNE